MSLCQVVELALIDSVRKLTDIDQNYSNVSLNRNNGVMGHLVACPWCSCISNLLLMPRTKTLKTKKPNICLPPPNLCSPLKAFACVSLRYIKRCGGLVAIVVVVCGEMCGKIEKLLDWNKNWCGSRY